MPSSILYQAIYFRQFANGWFLCLYHGQDAAIVLSRRFPFVTENLALKSSFEVLFVALGFRIFYPVKCSFRRTARVQALILSFFEEDLRTEVLQVHLLYLNMCDLSAFIIIAAIFQDA